MAFSILGMDVLRVLGDLNAELMILYWLIALALLFQELASLLNFLGTLSRK